MPADRTHKGASRLRTGALLLLALAPCAAVAELPVAADDPIIAASDAHDRMTVPVLINGEGPFAFIVDTGADRTVVSDRLASTLRLPTKGRATLHSVTGSGEVTTFTVRSLEVGSRRTDDISAPALREDDLGAAGLLGIDTLSRQRVTLDFAAGTMAIEPASRRFANRAADEEAVIVVRGQRRYGQLILTQAEIGGMKVKVIIDTGAQATIGNPALLRRLRKGASTPVSLVDVTGGVASADHVVLPELKIGGATLQNLPIAFAGVHAFRRFGLERAPALLLGMDALRVMRRVSIDFENRSVRFALAAASDVQP